MFSSSAARASLDKMREALSALEAQVTLFNRGNEAKDFHRSAISYGDRRDCPL